MVETAERRPGQLAWVDHELRYEPNRRKARDLIHAGAIGELRHLELVLRPYLRGDGRVQTTAAPWTWWLDASRGGGILGAVGSHLVDLCRFWTGSEIVSVAGRAARRRERPRRPHGETAGQQHVGPVVRASGAGPRAHHRRRRARGRAGDVPRRLDRPARAGRRPRRGRRPVRLTPWSRPTSARASG